MKLRIISIIGVVLILSGGILLGYWKFTEIKYRQMYSTTVDSSEISEDEFAKLLKKSREVSFETSDEDVDEYIEFSMLDSDQKVDDVTIYQNVLEIPQFNIRAYIGKDTEKDTLRRGVGWHKTTAEPGHLGNCVIPGHSSTTYDCIFNGIENIEILDTFIVWDAAGIKHIYYVTDKFITDPYDLSILRNNVTDISQTTLYTCTDYGKRRLVIVGKEFDDYDLNKFKAELDKQFNGILVSLASSAEGTGLAQFLNSWGRELPVEHIALPVVQSAKLGDSHENLFSANQQYWFKRNEHIFNSDGYITNFYFNMWKFKNNNEVADS